MKNVTKQKCLRTWERLSSGAKKEYRDKDYSPESGFHDRFIVNGHCVLPAMKYRYKREDFAGRDVYIEENKHRFRQLDEARRLRRLRREYRRLEFDEKQSFEHKAYRRNARKAAYQSLLTDLNPTHFEPGIDLQSWIFVRPLGQGGQATAYHLAHLDDNENVIDVRTDVTDLQVSSTNLNY